MDAGLAIGAATAVVLAVIVVGVIARARRRARRERRRVAALTALAETMGTLSARLRDAYVPRPRDDPHATASPSTSSRIGGLPGREALLDHLADRIDATRASGSRLVLVVITVDREGASDAKIEAAATTLSTLASEPVHRVGDARLAVVLPGRGRAEALALIARVEAELRERRPGSPPVVVTSVAVERERGDDAIAMLARTTTDV